jgi:hypothetical protein
MQKVYVGSDRKLTNNISIKYYIYMFLSTHIFIILLIQMININIFICFLSILQ